MHNNSAEQIVNLRFELLLLQSFHTGRVFSNDDLLLEIKA